MTLPTHTRPTHARPSGSRPTDGPVVGHPAPADATLPAASLAAGSDANRGLEAAGHRGAGPDVFGSVSWPWLPAGDLQDGDLVQSHDGTVCRVLHTKVCPDPHSAIPGTLRVRITHAPYTAPGTASGTGFDIGWFTTADVTTLPVLHRYQPACRNGVWCVIDTHTPDRHPVPSPIMEEGGKESAAWRLAVLLEESHREQQGREAKIRCQIFADLSWDHQQTVDEAKRLASRRDPRHAAPGQLGVWAQVRRHASIQAARNTVPGAAQMGADWQAVTELSAGVLQEWADGPNTPRGLIPGPAAILTAWGRPEGLRPGDHVTHCDAAYNGLRGVGLVTAIGHNPDGAPTATVAWPHPTDPDHTFLWIDLRTATPYSQTQD